MGYYPELRPIGVACHVRAGLGRCASERWAVRVLMSVVLPAHKNHISPVIAAKYQTICNADTSLTPHHHPFPAVSSGSVGLPLIRLTHPGYRTVALPSTPRLFAPPRATAVHRPCINRRPPTDRPSHLTNKCTTAPQACLRRLRTGAPSCSPSADCAVRRHPSNPSPGPTRPSRPARTGPRSSPAAEGHTTTARPRPTTPTHSPAPTGTSATWTTCPSRRGRTPTARTRA